DGAHLVIVIFFFSSRRRHTRSKRDWSSDVCSSDLRVLMVVSMCRRDELFEGSTQPRHTVYAAEGVTVFSFYDEFNSLFPSILEGVTFIEKTDERANGSRSIIVFCHPQE